MAKVKKKTNTGNLLRKKSKRSHKVSEVEPVWKGPTQDGITQSLLSIYLVCKERFRLRVIDGWTADEGFSHRLGYGDMWHTCEEALAAGRDWLADLRAFCVQLCNQYRNDSVQIDKWYQVCKVQFPEYLAYWAEQPDVQKRKALLQEESFKIKYHLPSRRVVLLRGKWDSVDLIRDRKLSIYLQENKTKGDIDEEKLKRQLHFDLQTGIYLVALCEYAKGRWKHPIGGVRYNVVRRPLSGGKGTIRPHKGTKNKPPETMTDYYRRLGQVIRDNDSYFFMRWKAEVSEDDLTKFKQTFLHPVLENLLDDYEWWTYCAGCSPQADVFDYKQRKRCFPEHLQRHYRFPYGVWNPITDGGGGDLEAFMTTGSTVGLTKIKNLFPEL